MSDVLPGDAGYVFAAYMVFLILLLVYLGILGMKFQRISRDVERLTAEVEAGRESGSAKPAGPGAKKPSGV